MVSHEQERAPEWEYSPDEIVARDVSLETYLARYAHDFHEWDNGLVVKMSPIHMLHDALTRYLAILFEFYFERRPIGVVRQEPFVMLLRAQNYSPEPDLQIILNTNPHELKPTMMDGPADICIEAISPESTGRDRGRKFTAYEAAGVQEYWMFDKTRTEWLIYRLNANGSYVPQMPDAKGYYRRPLLPGFALHVPTLWQEKLPGPTAIGQAVQALLEQDENKN